MSETQNFPALLKASSAEIARALPSHLSAERMNRVALTCFRMNPALAKCTPKSVLAAVMGAAQLGLEPGVVGQCYLVPYNVSFKDEQNRWQKRMECTLIPGWQGLVDMVSRAGRATVWTGAVFEGDEFDYALGDSPFVKHKPVGVGDPDKLTHVYAIGRVKGAEWPIIEVWPIRKVRAHLARYNKQGDKHYAIKGDGHIEMYGRKVALLQVLKYVPKSIELRNAVELDSMATRGQAQGLAETDAANIFEGEWTVLAGEEPPEEDDTNETQRQRGGHENIDDANERLHSAKGGAQSSGASAGATESTEQPTGRTRGRNSRTVD